MLLPEGNSYSRAVSFLGAVGNAELTRAFLGLALVLTASQSGAHCCVWRLLDIAVGFAWEFQIDISSAKMGGFHLTPANRVSWYFGMSFRWLG